MPCKVGIDVNTVPRQAGYIADNSSITGISLMHDEGTGGDTEGGYGVFPLFPLMDCDYGSCPVALEDRLALRAAGADIEQAASPGYFRTKFVNNIEIETTSTRRAGLIRFTYPSSSSTRLVVVDMSDDLQRSFHGGSLNITQGSRVQVSGTFLQSYAGTYNYTAYACYDFDYPGGTQVISEFGTYKNETDNSGTVVISPNVTSVGYSFSSSTLDVQAGALFSFQNSTSIVARFGISMQNVDKACKNAEEEIPDWDWDSVQTASEDKWINAISRVVVDPSVENDTVVELLYSSLYRAFLVPANMTDENPYWISPYPFYDALFCSWDTFRTVHPLLSIIAPLEWSDIVSAYIDGWRNESYIPECRANTKQGYVQSGSDGMPILGDFAVKYGSYAAALGISTSDLYQALVDTAVNTPPNWYRTGRQNTAWIEFGYIPTDWYDPSGSTGLPTREVSRTLEYALGDFAVRQAALALGMGSVDADQPHTRSMNFAHMWNPNVTSDGFSGFAQQRYPNGSFAYTAPDACSPVETESYSCARGDDNDTGFYESSSWEMSFFAPQSMSTIISLMGGPGVFINRTNNYFEKGYYDAGNEPSFEMPWVYHYANRPDLSALRVRQVVFENFNTGIGGIPGNDDSGAMAALLVFHLLGLYPVPASKQLLIGSPMVSSYTLKNNFFNTTTNFTVKGFDPATVNVSPAEGTRLYVKDITINGQSSSSLCWISFDDVVGGGNIVIEVDSDQDSAASVGCGEGDSALPDSLGSGGFQ
ncbi:hypothetical protein FISHEDRAFT_35806 [Fistulina hepatica ATCC 64428]|uniref:Glycoside hydrolase family 92 protein n=1 Tax=Fistulina hepatica ATCC 64428 TaxID=1128425 RepID=A0A0D7AK39_9AGAR|nr:hypothetical protein FISHEDRAFT_35806 [Fistulina hepatica ATCC 64428]